MRARLACAGALAALAAGATAGTAGAVTIGSDLTRPVSFTLGENTSGAQLIAPTDAPHPLTAPFDGVLVRIAQRYASTGLNPGTIGFRIVSGDAASVTVRPATVDGRERRLALEPGNGSGLVDFRPTDAAGRPVGIPIRAGERLGVTEQAGSTIANLVAKTAAGASGVIGLASGQPVTGPLAYLPVTGFELALQGDVEPDADGDLTQDDCPAIPNDPLTGLCPPQTVPGPTVIVPGPTVTVPGPTVTVLGPAVPGPTVTVERRTCRVPTLRGLTRSFAAKLLVASGCRLGATRGRTIRRGRAGVVVAQGARTGATVAFGTKVSLTFSKRAAPGA